MTVIGRLEAFFETGTEGVIWSLHDPSLPGYDGLWPLYSGDQLKVLDGDPWEGTVDLEYARNRVNSPYGGRPGQAASGLWVHGFQSDLEPDTWAKMFFDQYRAILTPIPNHRHRGQEPHIFRGSSEGMEARLRSLDDKQARELYRGTAYSWLVPLADNQWYGLARDWEFDLADTLRLIGSPATDIAQYTPMPFDWTAFTRVALLFGVRGGLDWKFNTKQERADWLRDKRDVLFRPELEGVMQVRDQALAGITEW